MTKQAFNPFLPLNEYVPDGEPHVFGDRVYIYGSHDKEGGYTFCMLDYVCYSASIYDLTDWKYEGVIYKAAQDPQYPNPQYMYAPDVVQGNDGRYYLYYSMSGDYGVGGYYGPMSVAVCDTPAGQYEFLGYVKNADGTNLNKYVLFDPAVLNDNGVIRLYYGTQYGFEEEDDFETNPGYIRSEMEMFGRSEEDIKSYDDSIMGAVSLVLEDDMLTVKEEPKHIIPYKVKGTSFEEHRFFEAASMRKVGDKYYFIYSSWLNHELCYATSDYPDRDFTFGGTIVSNGDVGFNGIKLENRLNMTGTTHGSIVEINGEWYVFYHRLTHKSDYSRQACAERIVIEQDGSIKQVEITSCGLNGGPLHAQGGYQYPAVIACNITNGHMPHGCNSIYADSFPNVNNIADDRFVAEIGHGSLIGFKYFEFKDVNSVSLEIRFENDATAVKYEGPHRTDGRCVSEKIGAGTYANDEPTDECYFEIKTSIDGESVGKLFLNKAGNKTDYESNKWSTISADVQVEDGVKPLYLIYHGNKMVQLRKVSFCFVGTSR